MSRQNIVIINKSSKTTTYALIFAFSVTSHQINWSRGIENDTKRSEVKQQRFTSSVSMDNPSPMTHPCKCEHVFFYADVISASWNMLWVFPGVIPQVGKTNEVMGTPND